MGHNSNMICAIWLDIMPTDMFNKFGDAHIKTIKLVEAASHRCSHNTACINSVYKYGKFLKLKVELLLKLKRLWQKEELLIMSNFTFSTLLSSIVHCRCIKMCLQVEKSKMHR